MTKKMQQPVDADPNAALPLHAEQAELWSLDSPTDMPARHVSMPLGDYRVQSLPAISLPGISLPGISPDTSLPIDPDTTVSPEHIACKQALKPNQVMLIG